MGKARAIATIDCETDPFKKGRIPAPFVWGMYDGDEFYQHESLEVVLRKLTNREIIVYAHNGGKFDFHFMLDHLDEYSDIMIINGRIAKFKIGLAEFRDSFLIIPTALKAFKKDDFDYSLLEKDVRYKSENWNKIVKYLESDCRNLYEYVNEFIDRFGNGLTVAGTAMRQWQKMTGETAPKSDKIFYDFFEPYYYGGRVQCFQHGVIETDFNVIDINSAYPRAMLENHPIGLLYTTRNGDIESDNYGAAFFQVRGIAQGCFPFRNDKGALLFPDDNEVRDYFVTGWELIVARQTKTFVGTVIASHEFSTLTDFKQYINHFYEARKQAKEVGDKAGDIFNKLLMNSLYGKFGADPTDYSDYVVIPPDDLGYVKNSGFMFSGEFGKWILITKGLDDEKQRFYNVATSASITGYVRAFLFNSIIDCGRDNVLYCDTDSLAITRIGENITFGNALGEWKDEGQFDKAGISGKKLYIFRGKPKGGKREYKVASKGVKLSNNQLWRIAAGGKVYYEPENPSFSVHNGIGFINRTVQQTF